MWRKDKAQLSLFLPLVCCVVRVDIESLVFLTSGTAKSLLRDAPARQIEKEKVKKWIGGRIVSLLAKFLFLLYVEL